jgi:hypothetical protein
LPTVEAVEWQGDLAEDEDEEAFVGGEGRLVLAYGSNNDLFVRL